MRASLRSTNFTQTLESMIMFSFFFSKIKAKYNGEWHLTLFYELRTPRNVYGYHIMNTYVFEKRPKNLILLKFLKISKIQFCF